MTADSETRVVAAYVFAKELPGLAPVGRPPLIEDEELIALAVAQVGSLEGTGFFFMLVSMPEPLPLTHLLEPEMGAAHQSRQLACHRQRVTRCVRQGASWCGRSRLRPAGSRRRRRQPSMKRAEPRCGT